MGRKDGGGGGGGRRRGAEGEKECGELRSLSKIRFSFQTFCHLSKS